MVERKPRRCTRVTSAAGFMGSGLKSTLTSYLARLPSPSLPFVDRDSDPVVRVTLPKKDQVIFNAGTQVHE
jgi:hypothetical protein